MKKRRIIESAVCFVLAGVLCALSVFIAVPALTAKSSSPQSRSGSCGFGTSTRSRAAKGRARRFSTVSPPPTKRRIRRRIYHGFLLYGGGCGGRDTGGESARYALFRRRIFRGGRKLSEDQRPFVCGRAGGKGMSGGALVPRRVRAVLPRGRV